MTKTRFGRFGVLAGCLAMAGLAAGASCQRRGTETAGSGSGSGEHAAAPAPLPTNAAANTVGAGAGQPSTGAPAGDPSGGAPAAPPPPTANGPHAEMTGEHHVLSATLTPPGAVPGDANLTVEVHGASGYHVNNLYPVALNLQATNATAPAQLRRADAAEVTQQVASFHVPVHVTGAGATVTGTLRFAVCSEENCVPQTQQFAVNLPQ